MAEEFKLATAYVELQTRGDITSNLRQAEAAADAVTFRQRQKAVTGATGVGSGTMPRNWQTVFGQVPGGVGSPAPPTLGAVATQAAVAAGAGGQGGAIGGLAAGMLAGRPLMGRAAMMGAMRGIGMVAGGVGAVATAGIGLANAVTSDAVSNARVGTPGLALQYEQSQRDVAAASGRAQIDATRAEIRSKRIAAGIIASGPQGGVGGAMYSWGIGAMENMIGGTATAHMANMFRMGSDYKTMSPDQYAAKGRGQAAFANAGQVFGPDELFNAVGSKTAQIMPDGAKTPFVREGEGGATTYLKYLWLHFTRKKLVDDLAPIIE